MSADFPKRSLENIAVYLDETLGAGTVGARDIRQAVKAYAELAERCVMERAELSAQLGIANARLREWERQYIEHIADGDDDEYQATR